MEVSSTVSNLVQCAICREYIQQPNICSICSHGYHQSCIEEWTNNRNTCPTCENFFHSRSLSALERECLQQAKLNCSYCQATFKWPQIFSHESTCAKKPVTCLCKKQFCLEQYKQHITTCSHHQKLKAPCSYCHQQILITQYNNHIPNCPRNTVACDNCDQLIQVKNLADHTLNCLSKTRKPCLFCKEDIALSDYLAHTEQCVSNPRNYLLCPWCLLPASNFDDFSYHLKFCSSRKTYCLSCCKNYTQQHLDICEGCNRYICKNCIQHHKTICDYMFTVIAPCCQQQVCSVYLHAHERSCMKKQVPCPYCQQHYAREDMIEHVKKCLSKPVTCYGCGHPVAKRDIPQHRVKCPHMSYCKHCCRWHTASQSDYHQNKHCILICSTCHKIKPVENLKKCVSCKSHYCPCEKNLHGINCSKMPK